MTNPPSDPTVPRGPVNATLTFFVQPKDGSIPYNVVPPPGEEGSRNYEEEDKAIEINDIRGHEKEFEVNNAGFQILSDVNSDLKYDDFENDDLVASKYYPEIESTLLKNVPGAKRVYIFDHTVRRSSPGAKRSPVTRAHIDQTPKSLIQRVHRHMKDEAPELLKDRVRLINVWKPLKGPVRAFPLTMADSRTVPSEDLVPVEHRYPDVTGETYGVKYGVDGRHKWWYLSGIEENERVLLQCYDSAGGQARVAHSAFVDPRSEANAGRESIEVRALVFG
jgi:hypothetical protein